jgi:phosphate acyltransferase
MTTVLRDQFTRSPYSRAAAFVARPVLNALRRRMDHRAYNGASLLGLRGIVIKSHGAADIFAFGQALARAVDEVQNDVIARISQRIA